MQETCQIQSEPPPGIEKGDTDQNQNYIDASDTCCSEVLTRQRNEREVQKRLIHLCIESGQLKLQTIVSFLQRASNWYSFSFDFPCQRKRQQCSVSLRATFDSLEAWERLVGRLTCDIYLYMGSEKRLLLYIHICCPSSQ